MTMCRPVHRSGISYTEVEVELVFNETVSAKEIPPANDVVETLRDAVNNPNSTFNLTVDANSIIVTRM